MIMLNVEGFRSAMLGAKIVSLNPSHNFAADGLFHRFDIKGDYVGSKYGWYILFKKEASSVAAGYFGCLRRGITKKWVSSGYHELTGADKVAFDQEMRLLEKKRDEALSIIQQRCREQSIKIWETAGCEDTQYHPYAVKNNMQPDSARINARNLLILPITDVAGVLHGLQYVDANGNKQYKAGTAIKGNFNLLGNAPDTNGHLLICVEYATGCHIRKETGLTVAVVHKASNLMSVAVAWKKLHPSLNIVVVVDTIGWQTDSPDVKKAIEAAQTVSGQLAVPLFDNNAVKLNVVDGCTGIASIACKPAIPSATSLCMSDSNIEKYDNNMADPVAAALHAAIRRIFNSKGVDRIRSKELATTLNSDKQWRISNQGKPVNARFINHCLRNFGIHSQDMKFDGVTGKGFQKEWFLPLSL